jgi:hypothetical protein
MLDEADDAIETGAKDSADEACPLPGFVLRRKYMRRLNKSDHTGKRWQDKGDLVVRYFGKDPYVDLEATARRARGEDNVRRPGRKPAKR